MEKIKAVSVHDLRLKKDIVTGKVIDQDKEETPIGERIRIWLDTGYLVTLTILKEKAE